MKYILLTFILLSLWTCNGLLEIEISTPSQSLLRGSSVPISVHLSSKAKESIYLLKWGTPFETEAGFQVMFNNQTIPYEGIVFYRATPNDHDFVEIKSGETKTIQSELSRNFDFTKVGTYHIRLSYFIQGYAVTPAGEKVEINPVSGLSNELMLDVIENANYVERPRYIERGAYDCSSSQSNIINSAWTTSKQKISAANSGFNAGSSNYLTWFGARSSSREQRVKTVLGKLQSTSSLRYSCGGPSCSSNTYAYVYPTDRNKIVYLCTLFWTNGGVEQVRTIVHEATHFNDIGATQDYAYGQPSCKTLASKTPDKAIYNADNFCYYIY